MATTTNIPLTTLAPGSYDFGPASFPDSDSTVLLDIDRTVPGGLNSLTSAVQVEFNIYQSNDVGATWFLRAENTVVGGIIIKGGNVIPMDQLGTQVDPGTSRQIKANVIVSGGSVAMAGSLMTQ